MLEIFQIPVLNDNYIYLLHDSDVGVTAVVDPAIASPVLNMLTERNWRLDYILNTHHHSDHVGANLELKKITSCTIIGAEKDQHRIPGIDQMVVEGDQILIGQHQAIVLEVPGHTSAHIAYWFKDGAQLFLWRHFVFTRMRQALRRNSATDVAFTTENQKIAGSDTNLLCS